MGGKLEAKLLGLEEVIGMSVSIILLHLEEPTLWSAEVEGEGISLFVDALAKSGSFTLVTPTMGTWGGTTIIDGVVAEWSNFEDRGVNDGCDLVAIISRFKILAAGVPNEATSNCCIASVCRSSAKLCIWLARSIFCNAWGEQRKAVMRVAIHKRISGGMLEDKWRKQKKERSVIMPQ